MERKSIGSFVAALRRANGMTQKELADRLCVSDKAVSRWECGESLPDITLIPALAEVFGITADELLRGERKAQPPQDAADTDGRAEERSGDDRLKKQEKRVMNAALNRSLLRQCVVALGVGAMGLLAALIINFGFERAFLAFCVGVPLILSGGMLSVFFASVSLRGADDDIGQDAARAYRCGVIAQAKRVLIALYFLLMPCLPLAVGAINQYAFVAAGQWFSNTCLALFIASLLLALILYWVNGALIRRDLMPDTTRRPLQKRCIKLLYATVGATSLIMLIANAMMESQPGLLLKGTTYNDLDSFIALMETPAGAHGTELPDYFIERNDDAAANEGAKTDDRSALDDLYHFEKTTLADGAGNTLCEFIWRNQSVVGYSYDDSVPPITVQTNADYERARQTHRNVNTAFIFVLVLEALGAALYYADRRMARAA